MTSNIQEVLDNCEVIVINNREKEYLQTLSDWNGNAKIIDMVRVDGKVFNFSGYQGINW
jgi:hypothetical protein